MNTDKQLATRGTLIYNNKDVSVSAACASRYSLFVNFLGENKYLSDVSLDKEKPILSNHADQNYCFISNTQFDSLKLELNGTTFQLGKCKYVTGNDNPQFSGKLFFTDDLYDFYEIFSSNRLINLNDHFRCVEVILPQKNKIYQLFRDYTSNLTYDINVYKCLFDDLDEKYKAEDPMIFKVVQDIIIRKEGSSFKDFFDEKLRELEEIVTPFTGQEHSVHGYFFRKQLWDVILSSEFLKRTNLKPRGYAGDSKMMTMIYENEYVGNTTFAKIMHKHPIETKAAQAVRNRIKIVGDAISAMSAGSAAPGEEFKILSLACGPAREIEHIVTKKEDCNRYHFTLLDQDIKAIDDARKNIFRIEERVNDQINYSIIKDSIRTIISVPDLSEKWGKFDFIYSLGLFDYLTERVANAVVPKLYKLLKPGGKLIIGNFHKANETKYYLAYWMDWSLYYRDEEEMLNLTNNIPPVEKSIFFDATKSQVFLQITRI